MKRNKTFFTVIFSSLILINLSCSNLSHAQDKLGINSFDELPKMFLKYENDNFLESFMDRVGYTESRYISKDENYQYTIEVTKNKLSNVKYYKCDIYFMSSGKPFKIKTQISFLKINDAIYIDYANYLNYNIEAILASKVLVKTRNITVPDYSAAEKNNPSSKLARSFYLISNDESKRKVQFSPNSFATSDNFVINNNVISIKDGDKTTEYSIKPYEIITDYKWKDNGYYFNFVVNKNKIDTIEYYQIKNKYTEGKYIEYEYIKSKISDLVEAKVESSEAIEYVGGDPLSEEEQEKNIQYLKVKKVEAFYINGFLDGSYYNYNNQYKVYISKENGKPQYKFLDSNFLNFYVQYKNGKKIKKIEYDLNQVFKIDINGSTNRISDLVQYITKLENYNEKGILNGAYQEELNDEDSGKYIVKGNYINGEKDGLWLIYFGESPNKLSSKTTYKNGIPIGISEEYDIDGNIISKTVHKN